MSYNDSSVEIERRHYYSSSQGPFNCANNIFMFYGGGNRGAIVETIIRSMRVDDRVIHVRGERGSGKTLLSLVLSDRLKQRYNIIRYDGSEISGAMLLRHLLIELCPQRADLITSEQAVAGVDSAVIDAALEHLGEQLGRPHTRTSDAHNKEKPYLLIIDSQCELDVQTLRVVEALASIRKTDLPVMHCLLFQCIEETAAKALNSHHGVNQPENHYWLRRLTLVEINEYLRHHMLLFDFNRRELFTREMAYFIADRSEGVFRSINTLARNAFMIANLENAEKLSMSHLLMAGLPPRVESSTHSSFLARHRGGVIALMASCVVASVAFMVYLML